MFWLRLFFAGKKSESRKAQFNKCKIYFLVTANHGDNAWEKTEVFINLYKEEQTRHVFNKSITLLNMFSWCWFFSSKYSKLHILFYFQILKYTSGNRSLEILPRLLHYYHIVSVRGSFCSKPYFSSTIGHRIKGMDSKEERLRVSTGSVVWNSFN